MKLQRKYCQNYGVSRVGLHEALGHVEQANQLIHGKASGRHKLRKNLLRVRQQGFDLTNFQSLEALHILGLGHLFLSNREPEPCHQQKEYHIEPQVFRGGSQL